MSEITRNRPNVLVIDDESEIRNILSDFLSRSYQCTAVNSAEEGLALIATDRFDLIISDINMPGMSGLELVPQVLKVAPQTIIVMLSGQQTIDYAIAAMRAGAFDYITKPFDLSQVDAAIRRALEHHKLLEAKQLYEKALEQLVEQRTAQVEHLASYDMLTGLPNRALFEDRVAQALAIAQGARQRRGTLFLALDGFKEIVDTLGHAIGDQLLKDVADRLKRCANELETVARFDGDQFAMLLTRVTGTKGLVERARLIGHAMKLPFRVGDHEAYVTASIGISLFPDHGGNLRALLKNAGAALYRARMLGGDNYQFYTSDMNGRALERLTLESSLHRAVEKGEFVVHYQPQVDIESRTIFGTEALVRWQHPELGLIPPAKFIGLAEKTGLIVDIGLSVMREACAQTRQWQDDAFPDLHVAVNVSARQLKQKDFVAGLVQILDVTGLDPASLELELTETSMIENPESVATVLAEIRGMGVRIAIDDFGTGYSSLSYLKHLPIDTVKLDRSFVKGTTTDPDDAALVTTIVTLAHNLELRVIAEGVETNEQANFLRLLRCHEGQGYLFGKATPAEVFHASLAAEPRRKLNVRSKAQPQGLARIRLQRCSSSCARPSVSSAAATPRTGPTPISDASHVNASSEARR